MKVKIIRSRRRTIAIELRSADELTVRAPLRMPEAKIRQFLREKEDWIVRHAESLRKRETLPEARIDPITTEELSRLKRQGRAVFSARAAFFAEKAGVDFGRISVRAQRTRFGSCSREGNLSFNAVLLLMPPEILDYVVVHELCHRKEMNHSPAFWAEVRRVLPDYAARRKWLRERGRFYIEALPGKEET